MLFTIYHPIDGEMNFQCERGKYEYECIATVEASSLQDAFKKAQNDFNPEYAKLGVRSTSVGDVIHGNTTNMIKGIGFEEVPFTVISYIDWGNH
jgi:hypothetical protein